MDFVFRMCKQLLKKVSKEANLH